MTASSASALSARTLPRRTLHIGVQAWAKLHEQNCCCLDRTALAMQLIDGGTYCFLSRFWRFGKSVFVGTLGDMFDGKQAPFKGRPAENAKDWSPKSLVICINFSIGVMREGLKERYSLLQGSGDRGRVQQIALQYRWT